MALSPHGRWIEQFDDEMQDQYALWEMAFSEKDYSYAREIAQGLLNHQRGNPICWYLLGRVFESEGNIELARRMWRHVLDEIDPYYQAARDKFAMDVRKPRPVVRGHRVSTRKGEMHRSMHGRPRSEQEVYESHCWQCQAEITGTEDIYCTKCKYYHCGNCNACFCGDLGWLWARRHRSV